MWWGEQLIQKELFSTIEIIYMSYSDLYQLYILSTMVGLSLAISKNVSKRALTHLPKYHETYYFRQFINNTFRKMCFIEKYYLRHYYVFSNLILLLHRWYGKLKSFYLEIGSNPIRNNNSLLKQSKLFLYYYYPNCQNGDNSSQIIISITKLASYLTYSSIFLSWVHKSSRLHKAMNALEADPISLIRRKYDHFFSQFQYITSISSAQLLKF